MTVPASRFGSVSDQAAAVLSTRSIGSRLVYYLYLDQMSVESLAMVWLNIMPALGTWSPAQPGQADSAVS